MVRALLASALYDRALWSTTSNLLPVWTSHVVGGPVNANQSIACDFFGPHACAPFVGAYSPAS